MKRCIITSWLLLLLAACLQAGLVPPQDELMIETQLETKGYQQISSNAPREDNNSADNYRLPNNTVPIAYDVELWTTVDTGARPFQGTVKIDLQVITDSKTITLHARQTDNHEATLQSKDNAASTPIKLTVDWELKREFLTLTPVDSTTTLAKDSNWTLTITYTGQLREDNGGFYISSYTDSDKVVHYLATTQFESTNARHAFPCYDEPAKRANFAITIHHNPSYTAISNMPVDESKSSSGKTVFQTTPKMSTYLIAFIVSDFEYTTGELNGLRQRVFSRKGMQDQQDWTLLAGLVVESSLAKYFDVPFALPKLDQAGIPDFSAGAMENWGLATYREQYMWWTKDKSTINLKTNIANIIGHEYAHMWFGDLVSLKWWTYLWLKEGFATLFSYESNNIAFPEWDTYQIFHVSDYNSALINDANINTPMSHYVQTPSEISNRYGTISYAKPASVLYMFKHAWTDAVFRRGLNHYLTKNKFNSTDEWDLFASFQDAIDSGNGNKLPVPLADIFSSWSQQAGYPLLTVERNYQTGTFTVKQQRYLNDKETTNEMTWYVPINYATTSSPDDRNTSASHYLLKVKETTVSDAKIANDDWLLLNKQSTGYYRILYDEENYHRIAKGLWEHPYSFHTRNRAQLMHDAYRFVDTGRIKHSILFQLMSYLSKEDQYAPWSTANSILTVYDRYLRGDEHYVRFREFVIELVEGIFVRLGVNEIPGEHYLNNYLRVTVMSLACQVGSPKCTQHSHQKLHQLLVNNIPIEPTLKTTAYCAGMRQAEDNTFEHAFGKLLSSTVENDRTLYMLSLGCSESPTQLKKLVESSIDKTNNLSPSERTTVLPSAYKTSEAGLTASLEFLETNWQAYAELNTSATHKPLDVVLRNMAISVVSEKQKKRLNTLIDTIKGNNGLQYLTDNLETVVNSNMDANFQWLKVHREPVVNWLLAQRSGSATLSASIFATLITLLVCKFF